MDPQTLELLRCLQSGPHDEPAWEHLRSMLRTQRRALRAQQDLGTLTDIAQLLATWAQSCTNARLGGDVLREAADVAERDLSKTSMAADFRKRAVAIGHAESRKAGAARATPSKRRKDMTDLNQAIAEYERALNDDADMETVYHLAELYSQRGEPGDAQQAADLYYTLGDVLGHPAGLAMLQRALEHVPDHADARRLLAQYEAMPGNAPANQQTLPAKPDPAVEKLGPAPRIHGAPTGDALRARTQPKKNLKSTSLGIGPRPGAISAARPSTEQRNRRATPAYSNGAAAAAATEHAAPRLAVPAPAGGDPRKTAPGIAPAVVEANLASGGKTFGNGTEARQGNTALAADTVDEPFTSPERAGKAPPPLRVARAPEPELETATPKGPPPLRTAEQRRAAGEIPGPHPAPVITIMQSAKPGAAAAATTGTSMAPPSPSTAPSATSITPSASMSPSGTTAPVTSLSPVVTDESALERSRARLATTRARKRRIIGGVIGATAVSALGLFLVLPHSMQDAQQVATHMFSKEGEQATPTSSAAASQPDNDPQPMAAEPVAKDTREAQQPAADTTTTEAATTTTQAAATTTTTPEPQPTTTQEPTTPEKTTATPAASTVRETPTGSVRPIFDQANLRGMGKLTDQQLTAAFEKAAPKLDQCYAQALEKKPKLKGRLIFQWTVKPNGKVAGAKKQGGTIKDADLARCTLDAISETKFPKPKKQAAVLIRLPLEYKKS